MKNDVLKIFAQKAKRRLVGKEIPVNAKVKIIPDEDEDFRDRVSNLLSQEGVVSNPVHYLIDEKIMKGLNEENRERYLLATLDRYNSLRREMEALAMFQNQVI